MHLLENRRLEGKDKIMRKLRQNQEFLMSTTLSPKAPVWTKWHEERASNSLMERDLTRAPNQKYISVISRNTVPTLSSSSSIKLQL